MTKVGVRGRRFNEAPWPATWEQRLEGWDEGLAYRMDWPRHTARRQQGTMALLARGDVELGHPALIGPDYNGMLMAFSRLAVNEAWRVWKAYGLGDLASTRWHVAWLNGANPDGISGFRSGWGSWGIDVMEVGATQVLFHPAVLGPLGRVVPAAQTQGAAGVPLFNGVLVFSDGLEARVDSDGVRVRGASLADGFWRWGRIEPWTAPGGWYRLAWHLNIEGVEL